MDMGVNHFLTDMEGHYVKNPRFYEKSLKRTGKLHHRLSRRRKGSRNREETKTRLARVYEQPVNQRNDLVHKLSRLCVSDYDAVAVEDLDIAGMAKNSHLSQKTLDASWGKFLQMLSYKAERAGRTVAKVNSRGNFTRVQARRARP